MFHGLNNMFRYPGGKSNMKKRILYLFECFFEINGKDFEFREPFFGGGSVGLEILDKIGLDFFWFNDIDKPLICLWKAVQNNPDKLIKRINQYKPSVKSFFKIKEFLIKNTTKPDNMEDVDFGFLKLVIHQISYSGLGVRAGGPIGGLKQESKYDVGCRWNPKTLVSKVKKWNKLFSDIKREEEGSLFTDVHFENLINNKGNGILYLDPPYFIKGEELYQHHFGLTDHEKLKDCLLNTDFPWVLSYDDCEEIREMYNGYADINDIRMVYTINTARMKNELIITSKSFDIKKINEKFNIFLPKLAI